MFQFFKKKSNPVELEEAGLLSAIWILASNDENPIMTYRYIKLRLNLPDSYDVEELIKKRSELFRPGVPSWRLEEWKEKLLSGSRTPVWLKGIDDAKEREDIIKSLTTDDVFRSQFRTKKDSPQSPIELIDWGLQHIERLRKAEVEKSEIRWKWLKDGLIPILSVFIALGTIGITSYWNYRNMITQKELKEYELTFKPKQEGYSTFMRAVKNSYISAVENSKIPPEIRNPLKIQSEVEQIGLAYYSIEPFLSERFRIESWNKYQEYGLFLNEISENKEKLNELQINQTSDKIIDFQNYFRENLYKELFQK